MSNSEEIDEGNEDFKKVYDRIVIKNRVLNEKDKNHINNIFEISKINDYNLIMYYEYILKLSFFSSNVNILNMYKLVKSHYEKKFEEVAKCLKSNILISLLDTNGIDTNGNVIEYFLKNYDQINKFEYIIGNANYPLGFEKNTNGIFQVFLFKIIPNKTLLLNKNNYHFMMKEEIPHNYDSIAIEKSLYYEKNNSQEKKNSYKKNNNSTYINSNGYYSYIYKVKSSEQILPLYLIEFEFKCLRIDVSIPSCEYCYTAKAIFYCYNDKAHLCDTCDIKHHEKNKILKNHKRIHVSESPYQFGKCPYHPHELLENVCMKCFCSLCSNCLLIGNHSSISHRNHPITNIKDAFVLSNRKMSISEINLENRKSRILNLLKKKHKLLSEIYSNYASLQKRIDTLYKYIINELKTVKKKKVDFLMALKRSILSELLVIEWVEAFFFHTKLSLNLSDFISYQKKHDLLTHFLTLKEKEINLVKYTPQWIFQKVFIHSNLYIYEDNFYKLNLSNNKNLDLMIKDKKNKENILKINENKLESIYNFSNIFNNKNMHLGLYEDMKLSNISNGLGKEDENIKYSKLISKDNKNDYFSTEKNIYDINENDIIKEIHEDKILGDNDKLFNKYEINKQNIDEIIKIKNSYSFTNEITNDKLESCNFLFRIFKNEKLLEKSVLKNSYVCNELWKNFLNYKYINIIHILKVRYSYNTLELISSFLNISNYYDSLEDFVKHIIKHEIYTLLHKNIDYHTKIKVTQLLDNVTTLLCIQNLKLSFIIDKHVQMCFSEIEKNEKKLLIDIENIKNDNDELYKAFLDQKEKCKLNTKNKNSENVKLKKNNFIEELENELNNEQQIKENQENELNNIENGNQMLSKEHNILEEEKSLTNDKWLKDKLQKKINEDVYKKEKEELSMLKKIKEYMYVYIEKLINDITNIAHKDLNESIRFLFYLIHDEIDGINKNKINEKKLSIHTLTLCLDLFINSIIYPYIFYVHEQNINKSLIKNSLYKKVIIIFGQTLREISIFIFQIYNLGMYDNNIKVFINNIKNNKLLKNKMTNENMFFLDVSQRLFNWIIKNLESPRYYSPLKWNFNEQIEKSYQRIAREIINIDKSSEAFCINENVDYNILFSTKNFKDILTLCYSLTGDT
ncbi:conserved Plasmodium protein, unknown function [Plasmodium relictum]|uniref:B box-type domain-containing protein n=1 Tax=Plasmodium relictum TaxID=85471 RepID=A0A1J1HD62_PLARL|nr:conserved Plasmodium protein, unknown function [Plasmodium relictum]CRH01522.1 conserved Plasmodium protein, unknown function [Plasmodium relictum]